MKLSVLTKDHGSLCKKITVGTGDKLFKDHPNPMKTGTIQHGDIELSELPELLGRMGNNQALTHGVTRGTKHKDTLKILPAYKQVKAGHIHRTKEYLKYDGCHLAMLDHDVDSQCPHSYLPPEDLLQVIASLDKQWIGVGNTVVLSSSAGLRLDGIPVEGGDGYHLYFQADNAEQLKEYMEAVFKLSVIAGHGWIKLSGVGSMLVRSCFDSAVFSPERIDFSAAPILDSERLSQQRPDPVYTAGGVINCSVIPAIDEAEYEAVIAKLKGLPAVTKKAESVKVAKAEEIAAAESITVEEARVLIDGRCNGSLSPDDTVIFKSFGAVSVKEVLANTKKYDKQYCCDPSEPELGTSKAMYHANSASGTPLIHSYLHGGMSFFLSAEGEIMVKDVELKMQIEPIHPYLFADAMVKEITTLNPDFYCSDKIREGFVQQCATYNLCTACNIAGDIGQLIIPSPTGSGKSVSAKVFLSMVGMIGIAGLLVVSEVDVAKEAVKHINKLAGKKIAATHYKISKDNPRSDEWCELDDAPIVLVITHAMFCVRSENGRDIDKFKNFNGAIRPVMIIDERITLIEREDFALKALEETAEILKRDNRLDAIATNISDIVEHFLSEKMSGKFKNLMSIKALPLREAFIRDFSKLATAITKGQYKLNRPFRGVRSEEKNQVDRDDVVRTLRTAAYILSNDYNQFLYNSGKRVIQFQRDISNKFGTCTVLDATAAINPEYTARATNGHKIAIFEKIESRVYNNANLHVSKQGTRQSADGVHKQPKSEGNLPAVISEYYQAILGFTSPGDKVLVATFKVLVPMFEELNKGNDQIRFVYWGSKDVKGSNEFKDFNKAVIIGWYRLPAHVHASTLYAITESDNYNPLTSNQKTDVFHFDEKHISESIAQFFPRIRLRSCIDDAGNCAQCDLLLFTGGANQVGNRLVADIKSELPGINVLDYTVGDLPLLKKRRTKVERRADIIVDLLIEKRKTYSDVFLKSITMELNLKPAAMLRVTKSEHFIKRLAEEDIILTKTKRRGTPKIFRFWAEKS